MVQDLLPLVAALNKKGPKSSAEKNSESEGERCETNLSTTSNHYAIVESDHPYRPASVANYRVYIIFHDLFCQYCELIQT